MHRKLGMLWLLMAIAFSPLEQATAQEFKVAVVGGLQLCGVWPRLAERAEQELGLKLVTIAAAPKETIVPLFQNGQAALMLIHGGDETFELQARGQAAPLRVWAYNEHVIVGPEQDPAGVAGSPNALAAMQRIHTARAPFLAFRDPGSHAIVQRLWRQLGIVPDAGWLHLDTAFPPQQVLLQASHAGAYSVVGHIPVKFAKIPSPGLRVLFSGDRMMRRPYVVVTPGLRHPADASTRAAAKRLADFLLSASGQDALRKADRDAQGPWIFPLDDFEEYQR